ncbi:uncharacterized protein LOC119744726 isoform X1 [Patiria miniata]|uniref:FLYWCH-type domain-containing protein n=1 Tax=Patiria miniata TaxID=46514 RepID=A0A914BLD1_PATMI|nr:uncharacterized protein LOC119744726 isoform X1 [Patiria miniata]
MATEMEQTAMQELLIQQVIEIAESNVDVEIIDDQFVPGQASLSPVKWKRSTKQYKRICKPKLVDALGYVYNVKRVRAHGATDWQCTARGKSISCRATVKQKKGGFIPGPQPHVHMAESQIDTTDVVDGTNAKSKTTKKAKKAKKAEKPVKMTKAMLSSMKAEIPDSKYRKSKKLAKLQNIVNYQKPRLVDNRNGFTYSIKRVRNEDTSWKCILRDSTIKCPAVLRQCKEQFALGSKPHNHEGGIQVETVPKTQKAPKAKRKQKKCIAEQAWDIVNDGGANTSEPPVALLASEPQTSRLSEEAQAAGYRFLQSSSQRCRPRLVDSQGFMYNVKRVRKKAVDWQCTVRSKKMRCPVFLKECDGVITPGPHQHTHAPEPGALVKSVVKAAIKAKAIENFNQPTKEIVSQVLTQQVSEEPTAAVLSPVNLARMAYRAREGKKKLYFNNILCGLARFHPDGTGSWAGGNVDDGDSDNSSDSDEDQ